MLSFSVKHVNQVADLSEFMLEIMLIAMRLSQTLITWSFEELFQDFFLLSPLKLSTNMLYREAVGYVKKIAFFSLPTFLAQWKLDSLCQKVQRKRDGTSWDSAIFRIECAQF